MTSESQRDGSFAWRNHDSEPIEIEWQRLQIIGDPSTKVGLVHEEYGAPGSRHIHAQLLRTFTNRVHSRIGWRGHAHRTDGGGSLIEGRALDRLHRLTNAANAHDMRHKHRSRERAGSVAASGD